MGKLAIYESWKDNRKFTKDQIIKIYGVKEEFDYYCDYIKSRISTDDRKELDRLKEDIKNNKISKVIIRSQNHLSRDMGNVFDFMELASNNNCEVIDIYGFNHTNFYKFQEQAIKQTIEENAMNKPLHEINVREFRNNYDMGDLCMLEYIKNYISSDLMDLYLDVMNYNEIYANSWTIKDLFDMGKEDNYWTKRANSFIEQYNISKEDYNEFGKYFDKYVELRDKLLDEMGLSRYTNQDLSLEDITPGGIIEGDIIINPKEMNDKDSYTVARVMNFGNSVELHYSEGISTIEYGYKITHNYWESEIEEIDWFNKDMSEDAINEKLFELFEEHFGIQDEKKIIILNVSEEYDVNFNTKIPFESFDADNGNYNMSSFTEYYKDIFERLDISFDNISTKEISDGKYELNLDNNILDIRAWDTLEDVIDNIEAALNYSKIKDKGMEV